MKVKCLKCFAGVVRGAKGRVIEITDEAVLKDLLACNYVEAVEDAKPKTAKTSPKKTTKAKG